LLISDVVLPGMSGIELAEQLLQADSRLPVLLITGYAEQALPKPSERWQKYRLLQKPFKADELLHVVRLAIAGAETENRA